jgi:heme oxygenase
LTDPNLEGLAVTEVLAPTDLRFRLKAATQDEHQRLEDALDLLSPPLDRDRFARVLGRFWGFHKVWEDALAARGDLGAVLQGRGKVDCLRADLTALGLSPAAIDALPLCHDAQTLAATHELAMGSLYVIEGSTLGGQVISRALAGADWLPEGGLTYFTPYGAEAGAIWRGFQTALQAASSPDADPAIEAGAVDTFRLLRGWLA